MSRERVSTSFLALIIDEDSYISTSERKGGNSPVREDRGPSGGLRWAMADDGNSLLESSGDNVPDDWTKELLVV